MKALDALMLQLVWDRLLAIVEEQAQTLMRTAFSTVVREAGDLSAGVFDTQGSMLAQAITGTPGHVNAMARSVSHFLKRYPLQTLNEGDVLVTNDPWLATGHLNDFTVVSPVFHAAQPVALFASTSHIADVGGRGFGPDANEVFEEGINIPIMALFTAGARNETLMEIIAANVRDPVVAEGDLYSLTACNETGARDLQTMMAEHGLASLEEVASHVLETSRTAMQREINALPTGTYENSIDVDGYDAPVHIACAMHIDKDCISIDFTGSSPTSSYGINVPANYTEAYASFGVRCLVGNTIPNNAGSLETIRVTAPKGCILNALPPCAVSARHALGQMLPDVIMGCLEQIMPESVAAEGASCIWNPVLMNAPQTGADFVGTPFVINPIYNGGTGARYMKDGLSTTAFPSGVRTTPTEINEVTSPLIFERREFRQDSGGRGRCRGGLGQVVEIRHGGGESFFVSKMFDRIEHPARGRAGGGNGRPGKVYIKNGVPLKGKGKDVVPNGATLVLETPGGGGFGDPSERNETDIRRDVENGLVSDGT